MISVEGEERGVPIWALLHARIHLALRGDMNNARLTPLQAPARHCSTTRSPPVIIGADYGCRAPCLHNNSCLGLTASCPGGDGCLFTAHNVG